MPRLQGTKPWDYLRTYRWPPNRRMTRDVHPWSRLGTTEPSKRHGGSAEMPSAAVASFQRRLTELLLQVT